MDKIVFNSSMPRSGSELLQCILHQNPDIYASPTSPLLEYQFAARGNYNLPEVKSQNGELMRNAFIAMCGGMAKHYYEAITPRRIVADKNRGWSFYYQWVEQWNPDPKMVCMVRDLRSIIASMERIYRNNRHRPDGPDNPAELKNLTVRQRAMHWLNSQPIGLALHRTLDSLQTGIAERILFVRYEDLCVFPVETMRTVYSYIDEKPFDHNFQNIEKLVEEDDSHYGVFGNHRVARTLKPCKPEPWSDVIDPQLADEIRISAPWYFHKFRY